jgi:hypothetical protein
VSGNGEANTKNSLHPANTEQDYVERQVRTQIVKKRKGSSKKFDEQKTELAEGTEMTGYRCLTARTLVKK